MEKMTNLNPIPMLTKIVCSMLFTGIVLYLFSAYINGTFILDQVARNWSGSIWLAFNIIYAIVIACIEDSKR